MLTQLRPAQALGANASPGRASGTLRRDCLDRLLMVHEPPLRCALAECVASSTRERPRRTAHRELPRPANRPSTAPIPVWLVVGGLHHADERAA